MSNQLQTQVKAGSKSSDALTANHTVKRHFSSQRGFSAEVLRYPIQAKLKIGQPGDKYEQEADRVTDQIMRMPEPAGNISTGSTTPIQPPIIQRMCPECEDELNRKPISIQRLAQSTGHKIQSQCTECEEEIQRQPLEEEEEEIQTKSAAKLQRQPIEEEEEEELLQAKESTGQTVAAIPGAHTRIRTLQGGGQPLPKSLRSFFEQRFGYDFSQVRIHKDSRAAESAREVRARAYTIGQHVVFGEGEYSPDTAAGKQLTAHELTHTIQQSGSDLNFIQRAGDPAEIPPGFRCPTDLTPGRPVGTDVLFSAGRTAITPAHTRQLTTFRTTWLAAGGTDDILVHGYASTDGDQGPNWTLSCDRAEAVQAELVRLGIPAVRIKVVAHGESTDFSPSRAPNRHAVISTSPGTIFPVAAGVLTPRDNFVRRSLTRFGVGEVIDLSFFSFPPRPAADFGGLEWHRASGGGTLTGVTNVGTATYTAPAVASAVRAVRLELRVATGATAGRVISSHAITIVIPSALRLVAVAGSFPNFGGWGNPTIPAGTWGAGFRANEFIDPKNVSFQGVVFGEGTVAGVVTPAGSFLSGRSGLVHPANTHGPGLGGNATTGTPVSQDGIWHVGGVSPGSIFGVPICGASDFLWAIPWVFSVAGGPRTPFAGGFTANQHLTSTLLCHATVEKAGAGPFCRRINGTTC